MTDNRKPLIIYHGPACNDGMGAATAAYYLYGKDGADYMPMNYGKERDEFMNEKNEKDATLVRDRHVYILDFSFKHHQLLYISDYAKEVTMLDHHKTAQDELGAALFGKDDAFKGGDSWSYTDRNLHIQFDMNRSGSKQAWQHFHGGWVPLFAELLDSYDLWKWTDGDDADAFNMGVQAMPRELACWFDLVNEENTKEIIARGKPVVSFIVEKMKEIEKHVRLQQFDLYDTAFVFHGEVPLVNAPYFLASRLGNRLAKKYPSGVACIYSITNDGKILLSFRSDKNGLARQFAQLWGGGGHDDAAGASVPLELWTSYLRE